MSKKKSEIEVRRETPPATVEGWPSMLSLRNEIDRLFDDFGAGLWRHPLSRRVNSLLPASAEWALQPATELVECNGEYRVTAELPGMNAEDIDIKLSNGTITIRGEIRRLSRRRSPSPRASDPLEGASLPRQPCPWPVPQLPAAGVSFLIAVLRIWSKVMVAHSAVAELTFLCRRDIQVGRIARFSTFPIQ